LESQNKINILNHQISTLKEEKEIDKKELNDIKEKYTEKARQKRKLSELYEVLKRKIDSNAHENPSTPTTPNRSLSLSNNHQKASDLSFTDYNSQPTTQPRKVYAHDSDVIRSPQLPNSIRADSLDRFSLARSKSPISSNQHKAASLPKPSFNLSSPLNNTNLFQSIQRPTTPVRQMRLRAGSSSLFTACNPFKEVSTI